MGGEESYILPARELLPPHRRLQGGWRSPGSRLSAVARQYQALRTAAAQPPPAWPQAACMLPSSSLPRVQLGGFIFKYHAAMVVYGARRINGAAGGAAGGGASGLEGGASGSGLSFIDSTASPAEISQQLTPGSSGKGPFDLTRYAGFCRTMRVGGWVEVLGGWSGWGGAGRGAAPSCATSCAYS